MRHSARHVALAAFAACALASPARANDESRARAFLRPPARALTAVESGAMRRDLETLLRTSEGLAPSTRARLRARLGAMLHQAGELERALAELEQAHAEAMRSGDTLAMADAVWELVWPHADRGRGAIVDSLAERLFALAGNPRREALRARAHYVRAQRHRDAGRFDDAVRDYTESSRRWRRSDEPARAISALNGLGATLYAQGRYERARATYLEALGEARQRRREDVAISVLNNLGVLESRDLATRLGLRRRVLEANRSLARYLIRHGRWDEAERMIDSLRVDAAAGGFRELEASSWELLASLRQRQHRWRDVATLGRKFLAELDTSLVGRRANAAATIAWALLSVDSAQVALDTVQPFRPRRALLSLGFRLDFDLATAHALRALGRHGEAIDVLRETDRLFASTRHRNRAETLIGLARSWRAVGRPDSASACIARAVALWEARRDGLESIADREFWGEYAARLASALVQHRLEHPKTLSPAERAQQAFDALQGLKSRAFLDRLRGPEGEGPRGRGEITLSELQRDVLRPGELLLDVAAGRDTIVVFAVTRDAIRACGVAMRQDSLETRLAALRRVLERPPGSQTASRQSLPASARGIGDVLFAGARDWIAASRRVIVSPWGSEALVPPGMLIDPGDGVPREIAFVPSASVLADLRARTRPVETTSVLAVAGPAPGGSRPLAGAAREVKWLTGAFKGVRAAGPGAGPPPASLGGHRLLHIAAHGEADDFRPWGSRLHLGRVPGADAAGDLTAARIAQQRAASDVVVLSACETAAGRGSTGEGVMGLAQAFLSAGATSVVSTLWRVDDRATERFMQAFYDGLAGGLTVGAALEGARSALRREPRWADPFHWGAFVLVGEASERVALERRNSFRRLGMPYPARP